MFKLGLKLWSTNENYLKGAVRLYEEGLYDFIELYVIPNSYNDYIKLWKPLDIPFIIHGPHYRNGLNLSAADLLENNILLIQEAEKFVDELSSEYIILHPGIAGDVKETVRQLNIIDDSRIIIENKPYYTVLNDGNICTGNSPEEIKYILENTKSGFCLDIGHCFCAANAKNIKPYEYLKEFLKFKPQMFHLTDNDFSSTFDQHYHFGKGNFDVEKILNFLPENAKITLETQKDSKENLNDFMKDVEHIREFDFNIQNAKETDTEDVFNLSNDPVVRQNSFNTDTIVFQNHIKWFQDKLKDDNSIFYIIRKKNNNFIGYVRFDRANDSIGSFVITIHLKNEFRGKGFGNKLIKIFTDKILNKNSVNKIIAFVKENNKPSLKSFEKAGYKVISIDNINNNDWFKLEKIKRK